MAIIKCPECGKDVSDSAVSCPHCGYEINQEKESQYDTEVVRKKVPIKNKRYIGYIGMVMCVVGVVLLIVAVTRITNDDYKFYKQHYQKCVDGYNDTKSTADSFYGGYFKSSYDSIASSYKSMADYDNKKLWIFRIQAIVLLGGGTALILLGYKNYKKGKRLWH